MTFSIKKHVAIFMSLLLIISMFVPYTENALASNNQTKTYDFGLVNIELELQQNIFGDGIRNVPFSIKSDKHIINNISINIGDKSDVLQHLDETPQERTIDDVEFQKGMTSLEIEIDIQVDGLSMKRTNSFSIEIDENEFSADLTHATTGTKTDINYSFNFTQDISDDINSKNLDEISIFIDGGNGLNIDKFSFESVPYTNGIFLSGLALDNSLPYRTHLRQFNSDNFAKIDIPFDRNNLPNIGDKVTVTIKNVTTPAEAGEYRTWLVIGGSPVGNIAVGTNQIIITGVSNNHSYFSLTPAAVNADDIVDYTITMNVLRNPLTLNDPNFKPAITLNFSGTNVLPDFSSIVVETEGFNSTTTPYMDVQSSSSAFMSFNSDRNFAEGDEIKIHLKNVKDPSAYSVTVDIYDEFEESGWIHSLSLHSVQLATQVGIVVPPVDGTDPTLVSLEVTPSETTLGIGERRSFTAIATYSDGTTKDLTTDPDLTWASDDIFKLKRAYQADIGLNHVFEGYSAGAVKVLAQYHGLTDYSDVTVLPVKKLHVSPVEKTVDIDDTVQYKAVLEYSDGTTLDVTHRPFASVPDNLGSYASGFTTWGMESGSVSGWVADIDRENGIATANNGGSTPIYAEYKDIYGNVYQGEALLKVRAPLLAIQVKPSFETYLEGDEQQYEATAIYTDGSREDITDIADWSLDSYTVTNGFADVDTSGYLKAKTVSDHMNAGHGVLYASWGGKQGDGSFVVEKRPITLTGIQVTPKTATIKVGENMQYRAIATYSDNSTKDITNASVWNVVDTDIAIITTNTGISTALKEGITQISATFEGHSDSATLTVDAVVIPPTPVDPPVVVPPIEPIKGSLTIEHVYTDGTVIKLDKKEPLPLGIYMAEAIISKDFELVSKDKSIEVTLTENEPNQTVIFKYKPITGNIKVLHKTDLDELLEEKNMPGLSLKEYIVQAKSFDGYKLKGASQQSVSLTYESREQVVTFTYSKIKGTIVVKYVNEENELLAEDVLTNLELGKQSVSAKLFNNYDLTSAAEKEVVLTTDKPIQTVNFQYKKVIQSIESNSSIKGTITVNYVTTSGTLLSTEILDGLLLGSHKLNAISFDNYTLIGNKTKDVVLSESNRNVTVSFLYKAAEIPKEPEQIIQTGTVFGVIKDAEGNPIEGIVIELHSDPMVTKTDENGFYQFENVPIGKHTLFIIDPASLRTLGKMMVEVNKEMFEDIAETAIELTEENREAEVNVSIEPIEKAAPVPVPLISTEPTPDKPFPVWPVVVAGLILLAALFRRKNVLLYQGENLVGRRRIGRKPTIRINITRFIKEKDGMVTIHLLSRIGKKLNENTIIILYKGKEVYTHTVSGSAKDGIEFSFALPAESKSQRKTA